MKPLRYVIIANPASKRWSLYQRELLACWREHGVDPDVQVVPWAEIIPCDGDLDGMSAFETPAVVRLESPGRDFAVTRQMLQAGVREAQQRDMPAQKYAGIDWTALGEKKGELLHPALYYLGFCRVLRGLRSAFDQRSHLHPLSCPQAVAEMFDKNAAVVRLRQAGISTPATLVAPPSAKQLMMQVREEQFATAYVKLNTGSSAMGIAVVHPLAATPYAITSVVRIGESFYNTRRLQRIEGDKLEEMLSFILGEGACVQRGIRLAQIDGQNFDVRVVVIYGTPAFTIFRLSSQPMTNLHLGGRRGDTARCRRCVPTRAWLDGIDQCVEAARLYPSAMVGVDLVFERGSWRHYILEVNAFGDFFPGLTDARGRSVHRAEIEETATRCFGL